MFKKTLLALMVSTTFVTSAGVASAATTLPAVQKPALGIDLVVDGKKVTLPDTEPFVDTAGNTMVPIRFVSEKLGAEVKWDNAKQIVTISFKGKTIVMPVGSKTVTVDGQAVTLTTSATKKEGRVMVPLRFVSEALNAEVKWDGSSYAINIVSPEYQTKIDAGTVTLDKYGRELRANQTSDEWVLLSDTPDSVYNIKKRIAMHMDSTKSAKDLYESRNMNKGNLDRIAMNIKEYYKLALNTDYRTVNAQNYYLTTFELLGHNGYMSTTGSYNFVDFAKKNKLVVEGYAFPDMTNTYLNQGTFFVRTKFKFRVLNAVDYSQFNRDSYNPSTESESPTWVKRGVWYETYSDVALFTNSNEIYSSLKTGNTENMFIKGAYLHKELK